MPVTLAHQPTSLISDTLAPPPLVMLWIQALQPKHLHLPLATASAPLVATASTRCAAQVTVTSERDYSANAAITAAMHGFLAATVGTYHDFIKPPPQAEVASKSSSISQGILRALSAPIRFASDMSGRLRSSRGGGVGPRSSAGVDTAPVAMFMPEDNIVYGEGGWRFHHDQFAAALPTAEERTFADALIATKMWPVCPPCHPTVAAGICHPRIYEEGFLYTNLLP